MNKTRYFIFASCLVLSLFSQTDFAQTDKAKKIDEFIKPFAATGQFSGVVMASENGKVIYERPFGLANADFKIPNQLNTRIGIASITKYMTIVILNRLIESKALAMADKLDKFIPDFPNGDKITIEMLARHRSGIPHRVMPPEAESLALHFRRVCRKGKAGKAGIRTRYQQSLQFGGICGFSARSGNRLR